MTQNYDAMSTLEQGEAFREACEDMSWLAARPTIYFAVRAITDTGVGVYPQTLVDSLLEVVNHERYTSVRELIGPLALEHSS